jgi:hypothetical protein
MKKLGLILVAFVVAFGLILSGCGGGGGGGKRGGDPIEKDPPAVTGITLDKTALVLLVDDSYTLVPTILPAKADKTVTWDSSDKTVATVTAGKVEAKKVGSTTITAKAGEKTATCDVIVVKEGLNVSKAAIELLYLDIDLSDFIDVDDFDMKDYTDLDLKAEKIYPFELFYAVVIDDKGEIIEDSGIEFASDEDNIEIYELGDLDEDGLFYCLVFATDLGEDEIVVSTTEDYDNVKIAVTIEDEVAEVPGDKILWTEEDGFADGIEGKVTYQGEDNDAEFKFYPPIDVSAYDKLIFTVSIDDLDEWWLGGTARDYMTDKGDVDYDGDIEIIAKKFEIAIETVDFLYDIVFGGGGPDGLTGAKGMLVSLEVGN